MNEKVLPKAIVCGLRACQELTQIKMLGKPMIESSQRWAIPFSLDLVAVSSPQDVPAKSFWFLVVDPTYPLGSIDVYPAKKSGISKTFHHQNLNLKGANSSPWRTGKICLEDPSQRLGFIATGPDPIGDAEERIKWYLQRSISWVQAADRQKLIRKGDPFELPYYPCTNTIKIVHNESSESFETWKNRRPGEMGTVVLESLPGIPNTFHTVAFFDNEDKLIQSSSRYNAEQHGQGVAEQRIGAWWFWPEPMVLPPWQALITWADLRQFGKDNNVDIDEAIQKLKHLLREQDPKILLMGYPIPDKYGELPSEQHWQAILFPSSKESGRIPNGFRNNPLGRNLRDRYSTFADAKDLPYLPTYNWHPNRMQARGRLKQALQNSKIALIGCGALGSSIAELLIRGGIKDLLLIDHDIIYAENLVRHTLSGQNIGENKALALAEKLATVAPFSRITPYQDTLPQEPESLEHLLNDRNIVLDCTAMDDVLLTLGLVQWSLPKLFISASVGYEAQRLFIFGHRGHTLPINTFKEKMSPLLLQEQHLWAKSGETLQGQGCWSPILPARFDDILLSASAGIKVIEELVDNKGVHAELIVFEQNNDNGFCGLKRLPPLAQLHENKRYAS